MFKSIIAVIVGAVVAMLLVSGVEMIGYRIWPPPTGMKTNDIESVRAAMGEMPLGALVTVAVAWIVGAYGGALVARGISQHRVPGLIVGALIAAGSIANLVMVTHPVWFWPVALVVVPLAAMLGARVPPPRPQSELE